MTPFAARVSECSVRDASSRSVVAIGEFSRRRRGDSRDGDEDEDEDGDDDDDDEVVEMHDSYYDR